MAKLSSHELCLDFRITEYDYGHVLYEIKFLFKGESIIRDQVLRRTGGVWLRRSRYAFFADSYEIDGMAELISCALDTNGPVNWRPDDPDIEVAILPGNSFPFWGGDIPSFKSVMDPMGDPPPGDKAKASESPDDTFQIVVAVDSNQFDKDDCYMGEGLALFMQTTRAALKQFKQELEDELWHAMVTYRVQVRDKIDNPIDFIYCPDPDAYDCGDHDEEDDDVIDFESRVEDDDE